MNSKFKRLVASAAVFALAASSFTGLSITVNAESETDYIGSSTTAETFDSYTVGTEWDTPDGFTPTGGGFGVSDGMLVTRIRGNGATRNVVYTMANPVTTGKVYFVSDIGTLSSSAWDGASFALCDASGSDALTIGIPGNGGYITINGTDSAQSKLTVNPRTTNPYTFHIGITADIDTKKATVSLEYDAANGTTGVKESYTVSIGGGIGGLRTGVISNRSSTNQDLNLDNTQFYSTGAGGGNGGSSEPAATTAPAGLTNKLAATDADYGLGGFTVDSGVIGTAKGTSAIHYAKTTKGADGKDVAVKLFKDDTYGKASALVIPFKTIPGDDREIKLYTGTTKPENLSPESLVHPVATVGGIEQYAEKYITDTTDRTGYNIGQYNPFATLKFSTSNGKRMVSVNGGTAAEIKNSKVSVPIPDSITDATDLLVYTTGKTVNGDKDVDGGAYNTLEISFPELKRNDFELNLSTAKPDKNVYYVGKLNTSYLTGIYVAMGAMDDAAKIDVYGTAGTANPYSTKTFADADKLTSKSISVAKDYANEKKKLDVIKFTASADKPYIFVKVTPNKSADISSVKGVYSAEPGMDLAGDYEAEYQLVNTRMKLQWTDVTRLDKDAVENDLGNVKAYEDGHKDVFKAHEADLTYIEQTLEGVKVRDEITKVIKPIYDDVIAKNAEDRYAAAMAYRGTINTTNEKYRALLLPGMRCVNNYDMLSELVDILANGDAEAVANYKKTVVDVDAMTGVTVLDGSKKVFSKQLIDSENNFVYTYSKLEALKSMANQLSNVKIGETDYTFGGTYGSDPDVVYDEDATKAILNALKKKDNENKDVYLNALIAGFDAEVDGYAADFAEAFKRGLPAVSAVMADTTKSKDEMTAALNLGNMLDAYELIDPDHDDVAGAYNNPSVVASIIINAIAAADSEAYDTYLNHVNKLATYIAAKTFATDVAELHNIVKETGVADITAVQYEKVAKQIETVKNDLAVYDKAAAITPLDEADEVDKKLKDAVEADRYFSEDATTMIEESAQALTDEARTLIEKATAKHDSSKDGIKNIKKAEYAYNQFNSYPHLQQLFTDRKCGDVNTVIDYSGLTAGSDAYKAKLAESYKGVLDALTANYKPYKEENIKTINSTIASQNTGYEAVVDALGYATKVTRTPSIKDKKVTGYTYETDEYTGYVNSYLKIVDDADDLNRLIDGTVTLKDGKISDVNMSSKKNADRSEVDKKFDIAAKLKAIYDFRAALYLTNDEAKTADVQTDAAVATKPAEVDPIPMSYYADALVSMVYNGARNKAADIADLTYDDFVEAVETAYTNNWIDYNSTKVPGHDDNSQGVATTNTLDAYTAKSAVYKSTYKTYADLFEADLDEDSPKKFAAEDVEAIMTPTDLLAKALNEKLTELLGVEKIVAAAQAEADAIIVEIDKLFNKAVNEGYATKSEVAAANKTYDELVARRDAAKKNDAFVGVYDSAGNTKNYFTSYYNDKSGDSNLATVKTALTYWTIATDLYDQVVAGKDAIKLIENYKSVNGQYKYDHEAFDTAKGIYDAWGENEKQKQVYFDAVAENNGTPDIITETANTNEMYDEVISKYANVVSVTKLAENISDYDRDQAKFYFFFDEPSFKDSYTGSDDGYAAAYEAALNAAKAADTSVEKYLNSLAPADDDTEDAAADKAAKLELINTVFAGLASVYNDKCERYNVIYPAKEFTRLVNKTDALSQNENQLNDAQYAAITDAIDYHNQTIIGTEEENSKDSLDYVSEETMNVYVKYVYMYRERLEQDFTKYFNELDKGKLEAPKAADDEDWLNEVNKVINLYNRMVTADQKLHKDDKTTLDNIVTDNAHYALSKVEADKLFKALDDAIKAYNKSKNADAAITAMDAFWNGYSKLAGEYGDIQNFLTDGDGKLVLDENGNKIPTGYVTSNKVNEYARSCPVYDKNGNVKEPIDYLDRYDSFKKLVYGDNEAAKLMADYKKAVADIDIYNITADSYNKLKTAENAYWALIDLDYAAGIDAVNDSKIDITTGYGVIGTGWTIYNNLSEIDDAQKAAIELGKAIYALPYAYELEKGHVTAEQEDAIAKAVAAKNALVATKYGEDLYNDVAIAGNGYVENNNGEAVIENKVNIKYEITDENGVVVRELTRINGAKLEAILEKLESLKKSDYDFNGDGDVDIFDLNMAIFAALGRDVKVTDHEGNEIMVNGKAKTVKSVVHGSEDGRITLLELKAVVDAFSDYN